MVLKLQTVQPAPPALNAEASRYELVRARQLARTWASSLPSPRRRDLAAVFTHAALQAYAGAARPDALFDAPPFQPYGKLDAPMRRMAEAIGDDAAALPQEEALYTLTGLYTSLLDARERSAMGAFYTPPALAGRLLDLAAEEGVDWRTARVLDPASGGGAFLLPAAARICTALADADPAFVLGQIGTRLLGLELDPYAAWFGQAALALQLANLAAAARRPVPTIVRVADTLEEPPSASYDLVVGNPPYGRVTLTAAQRARFQRSLYGHANLYGVFTDLAVRWAKPGGVIAYLTPTSVLGGHYYSALRELLAKEAPPAAIDFVHARSGVFEDVLQETLLAIYRKGAKPSRAQVHYVHVTDEREARVVKNGTIGLPSPASAPWLAPRDPEHSVLIAAAERMPSRLADWGYSVSTGPLVWNRFKGQMRERPAQGTHPLIWAESVTADGRFVFRADKRNHAPHFKMERGDAWLLVEEGCVLVQRTTAKEQSRRLIAAELPPAFVAQHGGVIVENHLNMVRPALHPSVLPATVAAVLNSRVVDQLFRCISGSVAVSAFELEALPLPASSALRKVEQLVKRGVKREVIEAAIAGLYEEAAS